MNEPAIRALRRRETDDDVVVEEADIEVRQSKRMDHACDVVRLCRDRRVGKRVSYLPLVGDVVL